MSGDSVGQDVENEPAADEELVSYRVVGIEELDPATKALYRRRRMRRFLMFFTIPGLVLGTATVATAYGSGLLRPTHETVCVPQSTPAPERKDVQVDLLNSNDTVGLGGRVAKQLQGRDFTVVSVGNADDSIYVRGPATIYYGKPGLDQALLLQKQIPGSKIWLDGRDSTRVQLVLGYGFDKLVSEPEPPPPAPSEITVNVFNTTWQEGLAASTAGDLAKRGFRTADVGNDPRRSFLDGEAAVIRFGPDGEGAAARLSEHLPQVRLQRDDRAGKTVDLVLGNAYSGLRPAAEVPEVEPYVRPADTIERPCQTP